MYFPAFISELVDINATRKRVGEHCFALLLRSVNDDQAGRVGSLTRESRSRYYRVSEKPINERRNRSEVGLLTFPFVATARLLSRTYTIQNHNLSELCTAGVSPECQSRIVPSS